jgi:hypothetical protein
MQITCCKQSTLYQVLFRIAALDCVRSIRDGSGLTVLDPYFSSMDGVPIQIENIMNTEIMALFNDQNFILAKHPASLSKFGNALDAGNIHKAAKKCYMTEDRATQGKESVLRGINRFLTEDLAHLTKKTRNLMADTAVRVISSFQSTVTPNIIVNSFRRSVQWIPSTLEKNLALHTFGILSFHILCRV